MCREQQVCEADRDYLFQHFMNGRGVQKWEPLNTRGPQNDDQMNPWGPESEAPITRGIKFTPRTEGGVLIDHYCWNHLMTNQRLRCLLSSLQITCITFLLFEKLLSDNSTHPPYCSGCYANPLL